MGCTVCGSNVPCRCSDPALPCGCGSGVSAGGCCQNTVQATPTPFYNCAPACPENHTQKIVLQQFFGTITIADSWNIPACGMTAVINVVGLKSINIGAYIWNSTYGYFEVTAFNSGTGQVTILNHCNDGNAAPGTNVPSCTDFTITVPPCDCSSSSQVCVAVDFTAPANSTCLDITLSSVGNIQAGDLIEIGSGRYFVDHIVSSTIINICNQGEGITPGTPVIALNGAGDYQYCITVIESCCSTVAKTDGTALSVPVTTGTLDKSDSAFSNTITLTIANPSVSKTMNALIVVTMNFKSGYGGTGIGIPVFTHSILESVDGGAFAQVYQLDDDGAGTLPLPIDTSVFRELSYTTVVSVLPGVTKTYTYKGYITNASTDAGSTVIIANWTVRGSMLGVAV